jgi:hypothetical protein
VFFFSRIWTSSFVLYAGGWSLLLLALFYWVIDVKGYRKWAFFLIVIGLNSITIWVGQRCLDFGFTAGFLFDGALRYTGASGPATLYPDARRLCLFPHRRNHLSVGLMARGPRGCQGRHEDCLRHSRRWVTDDYRPVRGGWCFRCLFEGSVQDLHIGLAECVQAPLGPFDLQVTVPRKVNSDRQALPAHLRDDLRHRLLEPGIIVLLGHSEAHRKIMGTNDDPIQARHGQETQGPADLCVHAGATHQDKSLDLLRKTKRILDRHGSTQR